MLGGHGGHCRCHDGGGRGGRSGHCHGGCY